MSSDQEKREAVSRRAKAIYDRLMALPRVPADLSNNDWAKAAGVNTSFFTNLKNGSEPSIGNLRAVLEVVGVSLPEFFVSEAKGRLLAMPDGPALARVILEALPHLPRTPERRAEYLAQAVQGALALPQDRRATAANEDGPLAGGDKADAPPRAATKKSG